MKYIFTLLLVVLTGCSEQPSSHEIAARIAQSVVRMHTPLGGPLGTGSLVLSPLNKILILTNWHVCDHVGKLTNRVYYKIFKESFEEASIVKSDMQTDLCAVEVPQEIGQLRPAIRLGPQPKFFEQAIMVGYPLDRAMTPAFGYILSRELQFVGMGIGACEPGMESIPTFFGSLCGVRYDLYSTNIITYPGNSGSPVVNLKGDLIGVINSGDPTTNWGGVVPIDLVRKFLKDL